MNADTDYLAKVAGVTVTFTEEEHTRQQKIKSGQQSFRAYCNLMNPDFFQPNRGYQSIICNTIQAMYEKRLMNPDTGKPFDILIINLPPGFGKSTEISSFVTIMLQRILRQCKWLKIKV